jgi:AraC-like DNA-binding protein
VPRALLSEAQVSIRLIWPFARLMGVYPQNLPTLSRAGVGAGEYANPDTRIPHRLAIELLTSAVEFSGDPALGLRVGERTEPGDFDALEFAVRSCANIRESVHCGARHIRLLHDAAELSLIESAERAVFRYRVTDGVTQPAAANDYITATLVTMFRRHTGRTEVAPEIQFTHAPVPYLDEYARVFRAKVTFNAPQNALVIPREILDAPLVAANPRISAAFELHVQKLLNGLQQSRTISDKVRGLVVAQLSHGDVGMGAIARKLAMSVPTLRRRLEAEGITYSAIVDKSREQLARRYLREKGRSITDVVFLLGFSDVPSFHKAFRRWTGMTPAEYRASEPNGDAY